MGNPAESRRFTPEAARTETLDFAALTHLVADNPVVNILNPITLKIKFGNGKYFDPVIFQPIHTATVLTADGEKEVVVDGFHRLGVYFQQCVENPAFLKRMQKERFAFTKTNLTRTYLNRPDIVPPKQAATQTALLPEQYAAVLIPPLGEQAQVSQERKAKHLDEMWEYLVGKEIARGKYPSLFAFGLLDSLPTDIDELKQYFETSQESFDFLSQKLIRLRAATETLGIESNTIVLESLASLGKDVKTDRGNKRAQQQIAGLFAVPRIQQKFVDSSSRPLEKTILRSIQVCMMP